MKRVFASKAVFNEEFPWEKQFKTEKKDFFDDWNTFTAKPYKDQKFVEKIKNPSKLYKRWLNRIIKKYEKQKAELRPVYEERNAELLHCTHHIKLYEGDVRKAQKELLETKLYIQKHQNNGTDVSFERSQLEAFREDVQEAKSKLENIINSTASAQEDLDEVSTYITLIGHKLSQAQGYKEKRYGTKSK